VHPIFRFSCISTKQRQQIQLKEANPLNWYEKYVIIISPTIRPIEAHCGYYRTTNTLNIKLAGSFMFTSIFVVYYNNYYTGITHFSFKIEHVNLRFKNCYADYMPKYNPNDTEEPYTMQTLQCAARALRAQELFPVCVPWEDQ
jgi:hypothetical protein